MANCMHTCNTASVLATTATYHHLQSIQLWVGVCLSGPTLQGCQPQAADHPAMPADRVRSHHGARGHAIHNHRRPRTGRMDGEGHQLILCVVALSWWRLVYCGVYVIKQLRHQVCSSGRCICCLVCTLVECQVQSAVVARAAGLFHVPAGQYLQLRFAVHTMAGPC